MKEKTIASILLSIMFNLFTRIVSRCIAIYIVWNLVVTKVFKVSSLTIFDILLIVFAWALVSTKIDLKFKKN